MPLTLRHPGVASRNSFVCSYTYNIGSSFLLLYKLATRSELTSGGGSCARCAGFQSDGFSVLHKKHFQRRAKQTLPHLGLGQILIQQVV